MSRFLLNLSSILSEATVELWALVDSAEHFAKELQYTLLTPGDDDRYLITSEIATRLSVA